MNMTREDILRELELLPVWQLNPASLAVKVDSVTLPSSKPVEITAADLTQKVQTEIAEPVPTPAQHAQAALAAENIASEKPDTQKPDTEKLDAQKLDTDKTDTEINTEKPVINKVQNTAAQKLAINWLWYCPLPSADNETNAAIRALLHNMLNAMQLLSTDYQLVHEADALARYQPAQVLLFGVEAANTFLGTSSADITALGKWPIVHAHSNCWVIDHPADLLQTPALKRKAWQTMCEAKALAVQAKP